MSTWIYLLHPPRENFAATMTEDEVAAWNRHFEWLGGLFEEGRLMMAGATGGPINTGMAIFDAADEGVGAAYRLEGSRRPRRVRAWRAPVRRDRTPAWSRLRDMKVTLPRSE